MMMKKVLMIFLIAISSTGVQAASFDCSKATYESEKTVCDTPNLSQLDERMAKLFFAVKSKSNNSSEITKDQITWIKNTRYCRSDAKCLENSYLDRIEILLKISTIKNRDSKDIISNVQSSAITSMVKKEISLKESDIDWSNESFLQKFVDLDPINKQHHIYEEILKIKPLSVWGDAKGKVRIYNIKGCTFKVLTDANDNVIQYELQIDRYCPNFEFDTGNGFTFKSQTINFRKIFSDLKNSCFPPRFTTDYLLGYFECGQLCSPDENTIVTQTTRCGSYKQMRFLFKDTKSSDEWKQAIINDNGGIENYTKNCKMRNDGLRCDPNPNGLYDDHAIKLLGNERPWSFILKQ
jgi:uncharacterized protein